MHILEKIFACKNVLNDGKHFKLINILGLKFKFRTNKLGGINNRIIYFDGNAKNGKNYKDKQTSIIVNGDNNTIFLHKNILKNAHDISIKITGNNNYIELNDIHCITMDLNIIGHNHQFVINDSINTMNIDAEMGNETTGNSVHISKDFSAAGIKLYIYQSNTSLNIGEDCMFSDEIIIQTNDGHQIFDENGNLLNNKKYNVNIGNHVWIGRRAYIYKNAQIPSGCIVGADSLVTKKFTVPNAVIAGVPAKVIKENINWDRNSVF